MVISIYEGICHYFYFYYITCRAGKAFLFNKSADVFILFRWIERFRRQTSLHVAILVTCDDNVRGFVGRRLYTSTSLHKTPVSAQQNAATLPYAVLELRRFWHKNWNFRFLKLKSFQNLKEHVSSVYISKLVSLFFLSCLGYEKSVHSWESFWP